MVDHTDVARAARAHRVGILFVALAAMLFASKGLFAKALYQRGVSFELLVTTRALLAMPLFGWIALRGADRRRGPAEPRAVLAAVVAGIVCYYVGALVDFWALTLIDASVERVLLFSYPAMVVLIDSVRRRKPPGTRMSIAMVVTYVGIFLVMGGLDLREVTQNLFGALLVLVAALTTAIYFLIGERYTRELGSARFAAIGMSSAAVMLAIHFALFQSLDEFRMLTTPGWVLLGILALACMFIPGLLQAEGVRRVGAAAGAVASTIGPPTTIVLAAVLLGERMTFWQVLGSGLIVGSVFVLSWPAGATRPAEP